MRSHYYIWESNYKSKIIVPQNACNEIFQAPDWWIRDNKPIIEKQTKVFDFPLPDFPDFLKSPIVNYPIMVNPKVDKNGNVNTVASQTLLLDSNYKFNNLTFQSDAKLTLDIGNKDISIIVNQIEGGGHLDIKGTGTLTIYVIDNINLSGNFNPDKKNNLFIYIGPSSNPNAPKTLKSSAYGSFNASIYAKDANIKLVGSGKITGRINYWWKNCGIIRRFKWEGIG